MGTLITPNVVVVTDTFDTLSGSYIARFVKAPADAIDYDIDFTAWLASYGDTLSAFTVTADAGLTIVSSALVTASKVRAFISGGANLSSYEVQCTATTVGGLVKTAVILIRIRGRTVTTSSVSTSEYVAPGYVQPGYVS